MRKAYVCSIISICMDSLSYHGSIKLPNVPQALSVCGVSMCGERKGNFTSAGIVLPDDGRAGLGWAWPAGSRALLSSGPARSSQTGGLDMLQ